MKTQKIYSKKDLEQAFYESINYWSPYHGWEKDAFKAWYKANKKQMTAKHHSTAASCHASHGETKVSA